MLEWKEQIKFEPQYAEFCIFISEPIYPEGNAAYLLEDEVSYIYIINSRFRDFLKYFGQLDYEINKLYIVIG